MKATLPILLEMDIWLHSHYQTGEMLDFEIFSISGQNIPIGLLEYLISDERNEDLPKFSGLELDHPYHILAEVDYEEYGNGGWYISKVCSAVMLKIE